MTEPTAQDQERALQVVRAAELEHTLQITDFVAFRRENLDPADLLMVERIATAQADERERIMNEVIAERATITNGNAQTNDALTRVIGWLRAGAIRRTDG